MSEKRLRTTIVGVMKTHDYRARASRLQEATRLLRELRGDMTVNTNTMPLRNITLGQWHQKMDVALALLTEEVASVGLLLEGVRMAVIESKKQEETNGAEKPGRTAERQASARRDRVPSLRE